jgi:hypothetical protein
MTELRDYVVAQGAGLLRLAFLLTGHRQTAEDLVQTALEKVAPRWAAGCLVATVGAHLRWADDGLLAVLAR